MAEHESCTGGSDDWYTPPSYFDAMGCRFALDPCSPGADHWVPADRIYTKEDDGLSKTWDGFVFMNMPFGGRNGHVPWLEKFFKHGNGIGIVRAYTSSAWWHEWMPRAEVILFPLGKTRFIPSVETRDRLEEDAKRRDPVKGKFNNAPGHGIVLFAVGEQGCSVLRQCGLGMIWNLAPATDDKQERMMERAQLGIDGNHGFALLWENIQEGECEFEEITSTALNPDPNSAGAKKQAINRAYLRLKARLDRPISYFLGESHPDFC